MLFRLFTVVAVAALAISTWILSSPARRPTSTQNPATVDLPGYYLKTAVLTDYDAAGAPTIRMEADRIDQVGHGTEVELSSVRVRYQASNTLDWLLFGDRAHVQPGGQIIDVSGHVRLEASGSGAESNEVILTDTLTYDVPHSTVTTKSDVRVEFGTNTLTARGLSANLAERTLHLDSKVYGRFIR